MNEAELRQQIKSIMVENLMLKITPAEIGDDQPLFGPGSLGLDSVDALQLVVALDKNFGSKRFRTPSKQRKLCNPNTVSAMAKAVQAKQAAG